MKSVILLLLLFIPIVSKNNSIKKTIVTEENIKETKSLCIQDSIRLVLERENILNKNIELLIAQSEFESGRYSNHLTKKYNNIFSIMHYSKRETKSLGRYGYAEGRYGYCVYRSKSESVEDAILYYRFMNYPRLDSIEIASPLDFAILLKRKRYYGHYTDPKTKEYWREVYIYSAGLKRHIDDTTKVW